MRTETAIPLKHSSVFQFSSPLGHILPTKENVYCVGKAGEESQGQNCWTSVKGIKIWEMVSLLLFFGSLVLVLRSYTHKRCPPDLSTGIGSDKTTSNQGWKSCEVSHAFLASRMNQDEAHHTSLHRKLSSGCCSQKAKLLHQHWADKKTPSRCNPRLNQWQMCSDAQANEPAATTWEVSKCN